MTYEEAIEAVRMLNANTSSPSEVPFALQPMSEAERIVAADLEGP